MEHTVAIEHEQDVLSPVFMTPPITPTPTILNKKGISVQSYCPSKTFIARSGVNPLAAAGAALFSLIAKLRHTSVYHSITELRSNLIYEVKAFECAALGRHYHEEQIVVARYVICATLDETILNTSWGKNSDWQDNTLVKAFKENETTGVRVFHLLKKLQRAPNNYIDLLEFFYLCLSLGFEGKYRFIDNGRQSLDAVLDNLYRIIRRQRGDQITPLSPPSINPTQPVKKIKSLPLGRVFIITSLILGLIYFSLITMLHFEIKPINQLLSVATMDSIS